MPIVFQGPSSKFMLVKSLFYTEACYNISCVVICRRFLRRLLGFMWKNCCFCLKDLIGGLGPWLNPQLPAHKGERHKTASQTQQSVLMTFGSSEPRDQVSFFPLLSCRYKRFIFSTSPPELLHWQISSKLVRLSGFMFFLKLHVRTTVFSLCT